MPLGLVSITFLTITARLILQVNPRNHPDPQHPKREQDSKPDSFNTLVRVAPTLAPCAAILPKNLSTLPARHLPVPDLR